MHITPVLTSLCFCAIGLLAGSAGSLFGIGGGIITVPLLLLFGFSIKQAIAASCMIMVMIAVSASVRYLRDELIHIKLALLLEVFFMTGSIIGSHLVLHTGGTLLRYAFIFFMLMAALRMIIRTLQSLPEIEVPKTRQPINAFAVKIPEQLIPHFNNPKDLPSDSYLSPKALPTGCAAGLGIGTLSALLGIGGGSFTVPLLHIVMKIPIRMAVATSSFMITFTALPAALLYMLHIPLPYLSVAYVGVGAIAGGQIGPWLARFISAKWLRILFGIVLIAGALQMIFNRDTP